MKVKESAARFEISVRARLPRSAIALMSREIATQAVERWIETGEQSEIWTISLTIWEHGRGRDVPEIGQDFKGEVLRKVLRRALQNKTLRIRKVGNP